MRQRRPSLALALIKLWEMGDWRAFGRIVALGLLSLVVAIALHIALSVLLGFR